MIRVCLVAALTALCSLFPTTVGRSEGSTYQRQLIHDSYEYIVKNAYPPLNLQKCGAAIYQALYVAVMTGEIEKEDRRLYQLGCFDKYSTLIKRRPGPWEQSAFPKVLTASSNDGVKSVEAQDLMSGIRYVKIRHFEKATPRDFKEAAMGSGDLPRGLIIDLRNNGGGFFEAAQNTAAFFAPAPGSATVSSVYGAGVSVVYRTSAAGLLKDVPVVILVNSKTASGSELFAGVLRYWDSRRILIGTRTYGKALIVRAQPLGLHLISRLTVGEYFIGGDSEKGKVQGRGLSPDKFVPSGQITSPEKDLSVRLAVRHLRRVFTEY